VKSSYGDILIAIKNKKICYIQYFVNLETNIEHLSKAIAEYNFDVTIITISPTDKEMIEVVDGRKYYRIPLKEGKRNKKSVFSFIIKIIKYIRNNEFDIVHIGHSPQYFILLKFLCSKKSKFIFHLLSYPIADSSFSAIKRMIIIFIQSLFMNSIIIQSEELKKKMIGIRGLKKTDVVQVGFNKNYFYPVDSKISHHYRQALRIKQKDRVLIYSGVISKSRNLTILIDAIKKVHSDFQDLKLLMIGDGDAINDIKKLVEKYGIINNVVFTGRIPHKEVVNYICIGDIGISYIPVNESYNYNPPLKTFEYMACGLPTIATRTESNQKIITEGVNGILVDDTSEDMAEAILHLLKDEKKQNLLSENARKSIMRNDFEYIVKTSLIPIYRNLLGKV
jgi:glycosyltransferase involved in cell wall biosynthesis